MIFGVQDGLGWSPHLEVWALVAGLVGLYVFALQVIGPKAVPAGTSPSTRGQRTWFAVGIVTLWAAADWPVHDLAEQSLYSVHMVQHLLLTLVMVPAFLLATPEWLVRRVLGRPQAPGWLKRLAHPVVALVAFNGLVLLSHWPVFVNRSVQDATFQYLAHLGLVATAVLLWLPICGPLPELRLGRGVQMGYLFVTSIVPTVPASWLIFADGVVYASYVAVVLAAVLVVGALVLAGALGTRNPGQTITGNAQSTTPVGESLARAVQQSPDDPQARLAYARFLLDDGNLLDAVRQFDAASRLDPTNSEAFAYSGWIMALAGVNDSALERLDAAVAADPAYPDAYLFRGMTLLNAGRPADAVRDLERYLELAPDTPRRAEVEALIDRASQAAITAKP